MEEKCGFDLTWCLVWLRGMGVFRCFDEGGGELGLHAVFGLRSVV